MDTIARIKQILSAKTLVHNADPNTIDAEGEIGIIEEGKAKTVVAGDIASFAAMPDKFNIVAFGGGKQYRTTIPIEKKRIESVKSEIYKVGVNHQLSFKLDVTDFVTALQFNIRIQSDFLRRDIGDKANSVDNIVYDVPQSLFKSCKLSKPSCIRQQRCNSISLRKDGSKKIRVL